MSANERVQESSRLLGGALLFTGVLALIVSIYVSAKVGWSLADETLDRAATALILGLADFVAALLIIAGSILWLWGRRWLGVAAVSVSALFMTMGYLSAFGFFSNRIAVHMAQKAATKVDADYLKWAQNQTVNRDLPRSERLSMRSEVKAAKQELRATASVVSDKYAAAIATFFGWTLEKTQTVLTAAIAATAYAVKFSGLWFGPIFLLRRRRTKEDAADKKTQSGSGGGSPGSGGAEPRNIRQVHPEPTSPAVARTMEAGSPYPAAVSSAGLRVSTDAPTGKLSYEQFAETIRQDMLHGEPASSTRALERATGWSQTSVVRQQRKLRDRHNSPIRRFAGNGGGFHTSANG